MRQKILYVGNLRDGGNGRDRVAMFEANGFEVRGFNIREYRHAGSKLLQSLGARLHAGPNIKRMNEALCGIAKDEQFHVVFIDKGTWVFPETLALLKEKSLAKTAIHFTPDPQFQSNRSRHFYRGLPHYDLVVTSKSYEVADYEKACPSAEVFFLEQGYSNRILLNSALQEDDDMAADVVFVGHRERHYETTLSVVHEATPNLAIWGPRWPDYAASHDWAKASVKGAEVYGDAYSKVIGSAKIALGLLSKTASDFTTTRTFEIPAIGTFMLAERTDEHLALFEEGKEAEFFSSPDELKEKLSFYLANPELRRKIAAAGFQRCLNSGYSTEEQFGKVIDWAKRRIAS